MSIDMNNTPNPQVVDDISSWLLFEKKSGNVYCIGSVTQDKYIKVPEEYEREIMLAISFFDGNYSFNEIDTVLLNQYDIKMDSKELYDIFKSAGLTIDSKDSHKDNTELDMFSIKIAHIRLDKYFEILRKFALKLVPTVALLSLIIILYALIKLPQSSEVFYLGKYFSSSGDYIIILGLVYLISTVSLVLHELAHALTAVYYGLKPKKVTFSLYLLFQPMLSLRIPGLYTVDRAKRMKVWGAGMYVNLAITAICIILYPILPAYMKDILGITALINIFMVILNISPFMPLDGYYILSTLFKLPNLRKKSLEELKKILKFKKPNLTIGFGIYLFLSTVIMCGFIAIQVYWMVLNLINSIMYYTSVYQMLLMNRFLALILLLVLVRNILGYISRISHFRNKTSNPTAG